MHDLGYHVVWCPKYRRAVLAGAVAGRCRELIGGKCAEHGWMIVALEVMPEHVHLFVKALPKRSRLPTLWSRSFFVASAGAVSAATVQRYIDTQYERPWRKDRSR